MTSARRSRSSQAQPTGAVSAPRQPPSLKRRITVNVALLVTLVLTLMAVASTVALRITLDRQLTAQLSSATQRAHDLLTTRAVPVVDQDQLRAAIPAGSFVVCLGSRDELVVGDVPAGLDRALLLDRVRQAGPEAFVALDSAAGPVRAVLIPIDQQKPLMLQVGGRIETVTALVVGFDTSRAERAVRGTALLEVALAIGACAVILLLLPAILERTIRPINGMTEAARAVARGDVGRRLPADPEIAETVILADAVNDALDARQDAEARLRQFVADASHELRTPLTTIEGWAELHRQGGLSDPLLLNRAMDRIADSAAHLTGLVEDLALLARLDAGRPVQRDLVDLAALAAAVVEDLRVIDPGRTVTMRISSQGPASTTVEGDEQRLRQVILNLTGNALQHTPGGTPISIEVQRSDDVVTLSVSDTGPGIPPEHQARIFDRFYRAGNTRSTGGTGLGLAIVRSLVDAHGGTVGVRTGDEGTCFTVSLPAAGTGAR